MCQTEKYEGAGRSAEQSGNPRGCAALHGIGNGPARQAPEPQFTIKRGRVVISTAELAGISTHNLGNKVCSLNEHRAEIIAALDFLITGI